MQKNCFDGGPGTFLNRRLLSGRAPAALFEMIPHALTKQDLTPSYQANFVLSLGPSAMTMVAQSQCCVILYELGGQEVVTAVRDKNSVHSSVHACRRRPSPRTLLPL